MARSPRLGHIGLPSRGITLQNTDLNYIDVFAGCGGLSLGLHRAGWQGLFAVEKDDFAFATLSQNFLGKDSRYTYSWPAWLPQRPCTAKDLLTEHPESLAALKGKVTLMAGGPPCQGFSTAGRRMADDPRNSLVEDYLDLVDVVEPHLLIIENVRGFTVDFAVSEKNSERRENAAAMLIRRLSKDYEVDSALVHARDFGVPQNRQRFVLIAVRKGLGVPKFDMALLAGGASRVMQKWKIPALNTSSDAISDFEAFYAKVGPSKDSVGYLSLSPGKARTAYQKAMRDGHRGQAADARLARHTDIVESRFEKIIDICIEGNRSHKSLNSAIRKSLGIKKMATRVLDPNKPAPTITSMPDDLLHYREPRTLTVRENARLQSFPDWFRFAGKYTTGGHLRRKEVPRFTQVANAVPPLMAEAIGESLLRHYKDHRPKGHSSKSFAADCAVEATAL